VREQFKIRWLDSGREPQCPPNPDYPTGIDIIAATDAGPSCKVTLGYPARRCGQYVVDCTRCGALVVVTTAGRADDPRSVSFNCKPEMRDHPL
jgi:hypothetical protein